MDLEEGIKYAEEQERSHRDLIKSLDVNYPEDIRKGMIDNIEMVRGRYQQLAKWLRELQARREDRGSCETCRHNSNPADKPPCMMCKHNYLDNYEYDYSRLSYTSMNGGET